jgi:hypothetical protein
MQRRREGAGPDEGAERPRAGLELQRGPLGCGGGQIEQMPTRLEASGLELPGMSRARDTRRELLIARRRKRFHELSWCAGCGFCAGLWTKGCAGGAGRLVQGCLVWFFSKLFGWARAGRRRTASGDSRKNSAKSAGCPEELMIKAIQRFGPQRSRQTDPHADQKLTQNQMLPRIFSWEL